MKLRILEERGYDIALFGLGFSRDVTSEMDFIQFTSVDVDTGDLPQEYMQMQRVAARIASKDGGHNKFLEHVSVWLDIDAPRFWWQQAAEYRIGRSTLSESTMHTLMHKALHYNDFGGKIDPLTIKTLNSLIDHNEFDTVKAYLPESFLQRRIFTTNYKTLRNVYQQRRKHKLEEWQFFCDELEKQLMHPEFIR